jgi:hypothetical protein
LPVYELVERPPLLGAELRATVEVEYGHAAVSRAADRFNLVQVLGSADVLELYGGQSLDRP